MAVIKMKLLNIIGPKKDFDRCAKSYVLGSGMHVEEAMSFLDNKEGLSSFQVDNPYSPILKKVEEVIFHANIPVDYNPNELLDENIELLDEYVRLMDKHLSVLLNQRVKINAEIDLNKRIIEQLELLKEMDIELDKLFHLEFVKFRFGRMPRDSFKKLEIGLSDIEAFFIPVSTGTDYVWGMYFTSNEFEEKIDNIFKSLFFDRVRISDKAYGKPKSALVHFNEELDANLKKIEEVNDKINEFVDAEREGLVKIYSTIKFKYESYNVRKNAAQTSESFYIAGWMMESDADRITKAMESDETIDCVVEKPEAVTKLSPPTELKNNFFAKPFEEFVKMYGLPSYNEFDPTWLLAITYIFMFGIMYGDLGHGLVLSLIGFYLYKFKKIALGGIMGYAGISSMFFGILYGSVFGFENAIPTLFMKPLGNANNMNRTLILAVGIGVALILCVMVVNIINAIRQKDIGKIFFDKNGLAGLIFYGSLIFAVIYFFAKGKNIVSLSFAAFLIGLPILCMFFKEPLTKLFERKKGAFSGGGEYFIESFFELFETLLSFATNTISFVRVGAFALNHAGMLMVVFMFAEMTKGAASIGVIIFGNLVVIALEGLIVGIQVLRLEFYELFGRFFSGEGKPFTPLVIDSKNN